MSYTFYVKENVQILVDSVSHKLYEFVIGLLYSHYTKTKLNQYSIY